jgi:hypothetical protein
MSNAAIKKLTPVLLVEEIEPCLPLWIDKLGWEKTAEVPEGDKLGFVILAKDGVEVMYQSFASVESDLGKPHRRPNGTSVGLFIEISDLDAVEKQLSGVPLSLARRTTFYGMHEIGVTEGGGHMVIFAQPSK